MSNLPTSQQGVKERPLIVADLFCGAGGGTTGMIGAAKELGLELEVLAINHNETAIATHQANHVHVRHLCENLDAVWPRNVVPGGQVAHGFVRTRMHEPFSRQRWAS